MKESHFKNKILELIEKEWPISITQIALNLGIHHSGANENKRKAAVSKIVYHANKLKKEGRIYGKKIGGSQVLWPTNIEKLRILHELLEGM